LDGKSVIAVIAGARISAQLILEKLSEGWSIQDLLQDYPYLTHEQIIAANHLRRLGHGHATRLVRREKRR
jgi:hypothetical protein